MTNFDLALWSFPALLVLIFLRAPIGLAMIGVGVAGTYMVIGSTAMTLNQLKTLTYGTFSNYSFSIIPLFLLMGQFATLSGMSASLFKTAESFLGHRKGGVAMSAVGRLSAFLAGFYIILVWAWSMLHGLGDGYIFYYYFGFFGLGRSWPGCQI